MLLQCVLYIGRPALVPALARVASASVGGFQCRTLSTSASSQEGQRFTTAASKAFLANSHVRKVLVANRGEIAVGSRTPAGCKSDVSTYAVGALCPAPALNPEDALHCHTYTLHTA